MELETTGERLAKIRIQKGFSQRQLAAKLGIGHTLISDYERGRLRLHDDVIIKLAHALGVSADTILGITPLPASDDSMKLRIMKRVNRIEQLSEFKQKTVLRMIDGYVKGETRE
ncbi:helix-turn-helix transcriptional regulator [Marispirochaeta sp.]|uniref:helix-turn-helix domain-containing protein n=1 Tax=Marispirochaeta sp. TaxID=2038653 RepID=UPI0029C6B4CD|nr:helix-turn-helix transcriptional regulator [Marispirochaeta sp.]